MCPDDVNFELKCYINILGSIVVHGQGSVFGNAFCNEGLNNEIRSEADSSH